MCTIDCHAHWYDVRVDHHKDHFAMASMPTILTPLSTVSLPSLWSPHLRSMLGQPEIHRWGISRHDNCWTRCALPLLTIDMHVFWYFGCIEPHFWECSLPPKQHPDYAILTVCAAISSLHKGTQKNLSQVINHVYEHGKRIRTIYRVWFWPRTTALVSNSSNVPTSSISTVRSQSILCIDHWWDDPVRFFVLGRPSSINRSQPTPTPKSSWDDVSASSISLYAGSLVEYPWYPCN